VSPTVSPYFGNTSPFAVISTWQHRHNVLLLATGHKYAANRIELDRMSNQPLSEESKENRIQNHCLKLLQNNGYSTIQILYIIHDTTHKQNRNKEQKSVKKRPWIPPQKLRSICHLFKILTSKFHSIQITLNEH
jgi:hypothetical protein